MPKRLSFQLYSARKFPPLNDTLALLAKMRLSSEVEGFGGVYDDPKALRNMLDAHGLTMPTGHFGIDMLEKRARRRLCRSPRRSACATSCTLYSGRTERPKNAAGWKKLGKRLAAIGEWARCEGFGFGWHNHDFEFKKLARRQDAP